MSNVKSILESKFLMILLLSLKLYSQICESRNVIYTNRSIHEDPGPYFDITLKPAIIVPVPRQEKQTGAIIFLHGLGESNANWFVFLRKIREPFMKIIIPSADSMPITFQHGMEMPAWFDLHYEWDRYPKVLENASRMEESTAYVHHLIDEEIRRGIPSERIIIAGYFQGATLAFHAALSYPKRLAAIAALFSFEPMKRTFGECCNPVNLDIPILQCYLQDDEYMDPKTCFNTLKLIQTVTNHFVYRKYKGSRGYFINEAVKDLEEFCKEHVKRI